MEVNLEPVLDYIKAQNYKALEHEQNAKRDTGMDKWEVWIACSEISCCSLHSRTACWWIRFLAQSLCTCDAIAHLCRGLCPSKPSQANCGISRNACFACCTLHVKQAPQRFPMYRILVWTCASTSLLLTDSSRWMWSS